MLVSNLATAQPMQWEARGIGGGGALFFPSFSPHSPDELYIASDMGEYFHSTNSGESWSVPDFREIVAGSLGRILFTSDPLILYALDGAGDLRTPTKSTDGGQTWTQLTSDPTDGGAYTLHVDAHHTDRLLVSDYTQVFYSSNGGTIFNSIFTRASGCFVAGAFFDNDTIYVATNAGLLISSNGGGTFALFNYTGITMSQTALSFAGARQGGVARLFCLTADTSDVYPGVWGADYAIYRSLYSLTVGQGSWVQKTTGISGGLYPFFLSMSQDNIDIVYAAGSNTNTYSPLVMKTTNGGNSWTSVFLTTNNQNISTGWCGDHGDINWGWAEGALGFSVCSNDPNRAFITDWGFAHITTNGGVSWKQVYLATADQNPPNAQTPKGRAYHSIGLEQTSCWQVLWIDSLHLVGSYTDIQGIRSTDGGLSWSHQRIDTTSAYTVNTIYYTVKHPATGTLYAATSSIHDLYQSTYLTDSRIDGGTGQIWYSTDSSRTWQLLHNFQHPVIWLALDTNNGNHMMASVVHSTLGGIYVTNDLQNGTGATWTRLAIPPRTQGHPFNVFILQDGTLVCTYSARRAGNPLAFTQSSGVFVSTDGGASWLDRSSPQMIYWTKDLTIDPHDPTQNTWFVAVHRGWGGPPNSLGGLFKTTNRGTSWTQLTDDHLYAESCTISPMDSNELYLTTETEGLWYCSNLRSATPTFSAVMNYSFMHPLRISYNPYNPGETWLASFGNGIRVGSSAPDSLNRVHDLSIRKIGNVITLRWTPVSGALSYIVHGSATSDFSISDSLGTTSNTSFQDSLEREAYFYRVYASDQTP
jgi:photosystem II stability/assembly factor-like uncharacterized protein